jgi:hypothetical protein
LAAFIPFFHGALAPLDSFHVRLLQAVFSSAFSVEPFGFSLGRIACRSLLFNQLRQGANMFARNLFRCVVVFAVATPLHALAATLDAKTGEWEMTTTTVTTGMPIPEEALARMPPDRRAKIEAALQARAGKPTTHVAKRCITKEDLDSDQVIKSSDEGNCKRKILSKSANRMELEQTCGMPHPSTSTAIIEAKSPESLVANIDVKMQGSANGKVHVDIKGHWLGASCAGIPHGG